jgi:hypothetical protein
MSDPRVEALNIALSCLQLEVARACGLLPRQKRSPSRSKLRSSRNSLVAVVTLGQWRPIDIVQSDPLLKFNLDEYLSATPRMARYLTFAGHGQSGLVA